MKLVNVLREECLDAHATPANKDEALAAIVDLAKKSPLLEKVDAAEILDGLREREKLGSTGFGNGIAIPHCHLSSVDEFVVGMMVVHEGVDFDALDQQPVHLIAFIIAPESGANEHIKLLSAISQALRVPGAIKEICAQESSEALRECFLRQTHADLDAKDRTSKHLFHVIVQDEDLFRKVLAELAETEFSSVVIVEAQNTCSYLAKIPLFAGFWSDDDAGFCRLILAVVEKRLTNEALRRIEGITGNLDECEGVLVSVQETFYTAGRLGTS